MPYSSGHTSLGVIDIGSNSVRMVIYDLAHNPPVKIFNEKVICPLGKDLGITGHLNAEAASSAFKALQAYKLLSEVYHVAAVHVVGTAALRDAVDGADFIARVASEIGLTIRIITGDQEATYALQIFWMRLRQYSDELIMQLFLFETPLQIFLLPEND